ncbi:MAG: ATP-dependent helicase [Lachnospiraceae bacterium]|nr:ATP-dependent helicase [Lachnospiraceae bacterium]
MKYNKTQLTAVNHKEGPMLVVAGPGSGKTLVITGRTLNLCEQMGVNPINILVITFTKAAAEQMKSRFEALSKGNYSNVSFGTFHSVFFTILKSAYNYQSSNILKEDERYFIIKELIDGLNIEYEDEKEIVSLISSEISLVKGEMIEPGNYCSVNISASDFRKIYKEYNEILAKKRLIDFDDMLVRCYHLLKSNKEVLKVWQNRFKYILIDEFQDINLVQYLIIKMLAEPENNLFVVGDDDQSIYSFRGARPEIMLGFPKDYEGAKKIVLDTNYRCSESIVRAALRVIANNVDRFQKDIKTVRQTTNSVDIREFNTVQSQNEIVVKEIIKRIKSGVKPKEIAVLFRTNTQARAIAAKLMEYNVNFSVKEGIPDIYEHFIAKDIFAYIRCGVQIKDAIDRGELLRIINKPNRFISRQALATSRITMDSLCEFYKDKSWMVERICDFFEDLRCIGNMEPYVAINYIRNKIGYDEYLKEYAKYRKLDYDEIIETLDELSSEGKRFKNFEEWNEYIKTYREKISKKAYSKDLDVVNLMTFHSSKGLEFEVVFIIDVNESITPHSKSRHREAIEEERRMFYVAMTRAKNELMIFYSRDRYNKELNPSRFIGEIYMSKDELDKGNEIIHSVYGKGVIIENDGKKIKIFFDKGKCVKCFDIDYCICARIIRSV